MNSVFRFFLVLSTFLPLLTYSVNTKIEGKAPAFAGRTIRLSTYSDMVTNRMELLATASIDKEGFFSMQADLSDTLSCILSIGFRKAAVYLCPGKEYHCIINIDPSTLLQQRLPSVLQELPLEFQNLAIDDINTEIKKFNVVFENFITSNALIISAMNKHKVMDSIRVLRSGFTIRNASFLDTYVTYRMADLVSMVNRWDTRTCYYKYLRNNTLFYNNPAYMDYFNVFFEHYLLTKSPSNFRSDLDLHINKTLDIKALTDILGRDSMLQNERIRELVLIKNLGELYYHPDFQSQNVLSLIRNIEKGSKFTEHRLIAGNLRFHLTHLSRGSEAPGFSFIDDEGKERTLGDFRGKWVYLNFFTTWCESCVPGMKVMPGLKKQFGNTMEFISICCNENPLDLKYFLDNNKDLDWIFTNLDDTMEIAEGYRVLTYPYYVLIDPDGNIFQYPARNPENQLKEYLEVLFKQ
ncbi:MAG: TlpA family protein disulfide reductase [Bacteroidales bacterium]